MKRLIALSATVLIVSCQDATPVEPGLEPTLIRAEGWAASHDAPKLVPFAMEGTWWITSEGDPTPCEGLDGAIPTYLEWEGTATHMGGVTGSATNCFEPGEVFGLGRLLLHATRTVAANGDILLGLGSADATGTELVLHPDLSFEIAPVRFVGGTGRFSHAVGEYHLFGDNFFGGAFTFKGWISSVGSSK